MKVLVTVVSLVSVAHATDLPARSQVQYKNHGNSEVHRIFQNEPDVHSQISEPEKKIQTEEEEPRFHQVSKEQYDDFSKGLKALNKLLKPDSLEILKNITGMASQTAKKNDPNTAFNPEKLASLVSSAMSNQPEGFNYDRLNTMLQKWKNNMMSGPTQALAQAMGNSQTPQMSPPSVPQNLSFAQVSPQQYPPMIPYIQVAGPQVPMAYMPEQYAEPAAPIEEFTSLNQMNW